MGCNSSKPEEKSSTSSSQSAENVKNIKVQTKSEDEFSGNVNSVNSIENDESDDSIDESSGSTDIESCETGDENDVEDNSSSKAVQIKNRTTTKIIPPKIGDRSPRILPLAHIRNQLIESEQLNLSNRESMLKIEHDRQLCKTKKKLEKRQALSVRRMKSLRKTKAEIRKHKIEQKKKIQTLEDEMLLAPSSISNEGNKKNSNNIKIVVENDPKGDNTDLRTLLGVEQIVNEYRQDKLRVESAESYERLKQVQKARRKIMKRKTSHFFAIKTTNDIKNADSALDNKKSIKKNTWIKTNSKANITKNSSLPRPKSIIKICIEEGAIGMSLASIPERKKGMAIKRIDENNYYLQKHLKGKNKIKLGYVLYSINNNVVFTFLSHEVKSLLNTTGRPIELAFCSIEDFDKLNKRKKKE
jgi:hypothetical protein